MREQRSVEASRSAFPVPEVKHDSGDHSTVHETGMTKREYFAAAALQGLLAHHNDLTFEAIARDAVVYADGLLQELAK